MPSTGSGVFIMMEIGKLPHKFLADMLAKVNLDDRVIVGPGVGLDAAVIDYGERLLVAKTDPITFAADLIGWYAVNVNANDVAVMGAVPKWLMTTVLLPTSMSQNDAENIFDQILSACGELGVSLVGGHTEVTADLQRPIIIGCMLGEAESSRLVTAAGACEGDDIVLTKGIAIEGTALLAREAHDWLREKWFTEKYLRRSADLLFNPGISVLKDARIAMQTAHVHAMHDPTEGGLATGLMELSIASNLGLEVDMQKVPILRETQSICRAFRLDPLGLIASGCLIISVSPSDTPALLEAFRNEGINAAVIGRMMPKNYGLKIRTSKGLRDLPVFSRDEIARFFENLGE